MTGRRRSHRQDEAVIMLGGRPRLLHITTVPQSLFFLRGQPRYLADRGWEVSAVSSPGALAEKFSDTEGIPVHTIEMHRAITPVKDLVAVGRLWRHLRRLKPHIVDAHTPKAGLLGMIAAWLARVPMRIYHVHGLPFVTEIGARRRLLRWSEALSCALAHRVLCVSPSIREVLIAEKLCAPEKAGVLLHGSINGIDAIQQFNPERFTSVARQSIRAGFGIPDEAAVIGFVGRITRDKGVLELSSAWRRLREDFPTSHLLIVGGLEGQDAAVEDAFRWFGKDPRVHIQSDWVDDPAPLYGIMDVLAFPTHREGFGLVALEAAAMQVPVVASAIPGCVDALQDSASGKLVPAYDSRALSDAIAEYLRSPHLRLKHGREGRRRALEFFDRKDACKALNTEYSRLMESCGQQCLDAEVTSRTQD